MLMRQITCISAITLLAGAGQPAIAADTLCDVIHRFEAAAPEKSDNPQERRWIEFHWGFDHSGNAFWSWGCKHSTQSIAGRTCTWLNGHTNQEFAMMFPQSVMACYGYTFPKFALYDWSNIAGTIKLRGHKGNSLILDLNFRDLPRGEVAMRLAVESPTGNYEPEDLPPIMPMPAAGPK
jgi:hypothetical protein